MGYRSQVAAAIYGPASKVDGLVMRFKMTDSFNLFGTTPGSDEFGNHITELEVDDEAEAEPTRIILMQGDDWKWYEDFVSVRAWMRFMDMAADEFGLVTEFMRIGEETADMEENIVEQDGIETRYLLGISRSINIDTPVGARDYKAPEFVRSPDAVLAPKPKPATVEVSGSWGVLQVDPTTGVIVSADHDEMTVEDACRCEVGYRNIALFDTTVFLHQPSGCYDILGTGYWLGNGTYVEPLTPRMVWDAQHEYWEHDQWVELRLLAAPVPE